MTEVKIIEQKPVALIEVKEHLDSLLKEKKELNFRENKVSAYLHGFELLNLKETNELKKELNEIEISRLKETHIIKIIDLLPTDLESLKLILSGENLTLKQEDLNKIIETVKKYA